MSLCLGYVCLCMWSRRVGGAGLGQVCQPATIGKEIRRRPDLLSLCAPDPRTSAKLPMTIGVLAKLQGRGGLEPGEDFAAVDVGAAMGSTHPDREPSRDWDQGK